MGEHAVDEMSDNENDITPKIGKKRSGQYKGTSNFQKVMIIRSATPFCWGCKHKNFGDNSFRE